MGKSQARSQKSQITKKRWFGSDLSLVTCALLVAAGAACATVPPPPPEPPPVTWEDKMRWILRLEDRRILRDPNPAAPVFLVPPTRTQTAVVARLPPSDMIRLFAHA